MSTLIEKLLAAGWCYESNRPSHSHEKTEIYKDWEIITYPELAFHYLPTGEYFLGSSTFSLGSKVSLAQIGVIKALIDSSD